MTEHDNIGVIAIDYPEGIDVSLTLKILDTETSKSITSPPSFFIANWKLSLDLVLGSRNTVAIILPFATSSFPCVSNNLLISSADVNSSRTVVLSNCFAERISAPRRLESPIIYTGSHVI